MKEEYQLLVMKLASRLALLAPRNRNRSLEWNILAWVEHMEIDETKNAVKEMSLCIKDNFDIKEFNK